jgi:hypothetical protein
MRIIIFRVILFLIIILSTNCIAQKPAWPPRDWPQNVIVNIWIPKDADIVRYDHHGVYSVLYTTKVCYPAKNMIDEMVHVQTTKGWRRLIFNPINSPDKLILNHAKKSGGEWSYGVDKDGSEGGGWHEFWEDNKNNIVEYYFSYKLKRGEFINNACLLSGQAKYIPADYLHKLLKVIEEDRTKTQAGGH